MSSTNTQTRTARTVLQDYELHHSPAPAHVREPSAENDVSQRPDSPPWETTYRRVPPYRPVDTNLDQSQRRVYTSGVEQVFIGTMFTGVFTVATAAKAWHGTVGRVNDRIFRYQIGGEY
ncbi:uncharacterized protein DNG_04111 [Cephalotrichum gorgonifer]|uniref:Uncharacterized protein n=1 Tax=Cephalotrichum gorgonifer TaxID=2041049 RepID=A0AAE8SUL0_9PEZI|nr:uncharacterized protein DNG_04111 [Cephalotrichum gorgonifer]